jgi:hypothetical protein
MTQIFTKKRLKPAAHDLSFRTLKWVTPRGPFNDSLHRVLRSLRGTAVLYR